MKGFASECNLAIGKKAKFSLKACVLLKCVRLYECVRKSNTLSLSTHHVLEPVRTLLASLFKVSIYNNAVLITNLRFEVADFCLHWDLTHILVDKSPVCDQMGLH